MSSGCSGCGDHDRSFKGRGLPALKRSGRHSQPGVLGEQGHSSGVCGRHRADKPLEDRTDGSKWTVDPAGSGV